MTVETLEQDLEVYRAMYSELKKENERLKSEINRLKRGEKAENEPRQYQKTLNEISDNLDALERD